MEINGMAHVVLTASNFERSREFYRKLLPFLGLVPMIDNDGFYYCVGGRTALGISAPSPEFVGEPACITSVFVRVSGSTSMNCIGLSQPSAQKSSARRARTAGRPAITRCCSKTLMASGSKSIMSQARGCWLSVPTNHSA
jgi:catechol 2,3-dioxygenase-like lactoylglutathione lyase family enzyme